VLSQLLLLQKDNKKKQREEEDKPASDDSSKATEGVNERGSDEGSSGVSLIHHHHDDHDHGTGGPRPVCVVPLSPSTSTIPAADISSSAPPTPPSYLPTRPRLHALVLPELAIDTYDEGEGEGEGGGGSNKSDASGSDVDDHCPSGIPDPAASCQELTGRSTRSEGRLKGDSNADGAEWGPLDVEKGRMGGVVAKNDSPGTTATMSPDPSIASRTCQAGGAWRKPKCMASMSTTFGSSASLKGSPPLTCSSSDCLSSVTSSPPQLKCILQDMRDNKMPSDIAGDTDASSSSAGSDHHQQPLPDTAEASEVGDGPMDTDRERDVPTQCDVQRTLEELGPRFASEWAGEDGQGVVCAPLDIVVDAAAAASAIVALIRMVNQEEDRERAERERGQGLAMAMEMGMDGECRAVHV